MKCWRVVKNASLADDSNDGREFNPPTVLVLKSMKQKSADEQIWNTVFALFVIFLFLNVIPWFLIGLTIYGGFQLYRWLCSDNPRPPSHDNRKRPRCRHRF